jgi:NAD(P)-dependent dehydrogenase (short-subunit alcohol dehydrogenase family)
MNSLQDLFGLKGKIALVTGASSGLGVEIARGLALAGADVALLARRKERLDTLAAELRGQGGRSLAVQADLTDDAQIERALGEVEAGLGGVEILVNNAGIAPLGKAETHARKDWDSVLSVNLTAVFRLSQAVARGMIARGRGGRIVSISSISAQNGIPIFPTVGYAAAKAGVDGMTRQLAIEWASHNITVNAVAPGWFPTEMTLDPRYNDVHPKYKQQMLDRTPLGRLGQPGELMGAVIFLVSPAGGFVTGAVIPVDGGWLAW